MLKLDARHCMVIVKYNDKDISADLQQYLKSVSYTDNMSGEADDLQLTLEDKAGCGSQHGFRKRVRRWT